MEHADLNAPFTKGDLFAFRDAMFERFDGVDKRLDGHDQRFESLGEKIDRVRLEVNQGWHRMERAEENLTGLIRGVESRANARIDAFLGQMETYKRESHTFPKTLDEHGPAPELTLARMEADVAERVKVHERFQAEHEECRREAARQFDEFMERLAKLGQS